MSASDVIFIPDRHKSLTDRDKETVLALVSLENSFDTNSRYVDYVNRLPKKVRFFGIPLLCRIVNILRI